MYSYLIKKSGESYKITEEEKNQIMRKWLDKSQWDNPITIGGSTFLIKDIKEIIDDRPARIDNEGFLRRLEEIKTINKKRQIKEWADLEEEQYQLLGNKTKCVAMGDEETSKDIQNQLVSNSIKMKQIAKNHGL